MDSYEAIAICNALASEPRTNSSDSNAICRVLAENAKLREFIDRARRESELLPNPGQNAGARVSVPYWFMRNPQ